MRSLIPIALLAACSGDPSRPADSPKPTDPTSAAPKPAAPPPKDTAVNPLEALQLGSAESLFLAHVDKASAVFIGKLVELGPPPRSYSGYNVAMQALTYDVTRVIRGDVGTGRITVHHVIVGRSPALVDGKPELKPEHVEVGAEYVVALGGVVEGKRVTANENVAPVKATADFVAKVERKQKQAPAP